MQYSFTQDHVFCCYSLLKCSHFLLHYMKIQDHTFEDLSTSYYKFIFNGCILFTHTHTHSLSLFLNFPMYDWMGAFVIERVINMDTGLRRSTRQIPLKQNKKQPPSYVMNEEYDQLTEFIHILPDEEPLPLTASDLVFNHLQLTLKMQCELVALEENPIVFDYSEYQPIYTTQLDLPLYQTTLPQCCIQKTDEHNLCGSSLLPPTWNISFDDYHQVFNTGLFLENNDILKLPFYEESMKEEPVPSCLSVSSMSDYSEDEEDPLDPLLSYPYFAFYSTNSVSQFEERESDVGMNVIKKGRNVEKACNHCKRSHLKCDKVRPCSRCVASGKIGCEDVDHKPRGRPRLQKKQDELMLS